MKKTILAIAIMLNSQALLARQYKINGGCKAYPVDTLKGMTFKVVNPVTHFGLIAEAGTNDINVSIVEIGNKIEMTITKMTPQQFSTSTRSQLVNNKVLFDKSLYADVAGAGVECLIEANRIN